MASMELGGDGAEMARAWGWDHRIGPHYLRAGIGWGASCFFRHEQARTSGFTYMAVGRHP
jgi:UDP-glucose 6-dehydrogenase